MSEQVRLTVAADEGAAEVVCGMLRSEGIKCFERVTDVAAESFPGPNAWREIVVLAADLDRARELLEASVPAVDECVRCGHTIGEDGAGFPTRAATSRPAVRYARSACSGRPSA
jgi:hypothetical protein